MHRLMCIGQPSPLHIYTRTRTVTRVSIVLNYSCLQPTYLYLQAILYEIKFDLTREVIFRDGARVLEAKYFGSSYGKKKGVGLTAPQLADKRFSRHATDVLNETHNFKMMKLCRALPVPPCGLAGSISRV